MSTQENLAEHLVKGSKNISRPYPLPMAIRQQTTKQQWKTLV